MTPGGTQSITSDFAFHITCGTADTQPADDAVEAFLLANGFRVLNTVQAAGARKEPAPFSQDIIGLDAHDRVVEFVKLPLGRGTTRVALTTRPPTRRSDTLETAMLAFANRTGCPVDHVERHTNPVEAIGMFDGLMTIYRTWFQDYGRSRPSI